MNVTRIFGKYKFLQVVRTLSEVLHPCLLLFPSYILKNMSVEKSVVQTLLFAKKNKAG